MIKYRVTYYDSDGGLNQKVFTSKECFMNNLKITVLKVQEFFDEYL